jgi:rubrerythrin
LAPPPAVLAMLSEARAAEKEQALFYRALALAAEQRGDDAQSERLNGLHADEQHHLSRLSARLVELEQALEDLAVVAAPACNPLDWEATARWRERAEIARYESILRAPLDARTRAMILEFLESERWHEAELGGKWMGA